MENNIFGIDASEFAVRITLFRLMLERLDAQKNDAEKGDAQEFPDISFNVFVANSLIRLPSEKEGILPGIDKPLKYEEDSQARYYKADVLYLNFKKPSRADDSEMTDDGVILRYEGDEDEKLAKEPTNEKYGEFGGTKARYEAVIAVFQLKWDETGDDTPQVYIEDGSHRIVCLE